MSEFRLKVDGMVVAGAAGPTAEAQIMHYALVYSQDGPVTVQELSNGRWRNFLKMRRGEAK